MTKKELVSRKPLRLKEHDYRTAGRYFVTLCAKDGHEMFGKIAVGANCVRPTNVGEVIEKEIGVLSTTYEYLAVEKHVIMPNHIHMLLILDSAVGRTQFAPTISRAIKQFKGSVTKQIGFSVWQRSFHDRVVRGEDEYQKIRKYIDENPMRWTQDKYYPKKDSDE